MASEVRERERVLVTGFVRAGIAGMEAGGYLTKEQAARLDAVIETALGNARRHEAACQQDKPKKRRTKP